jgi:hypothetical protein
VNSPVISCNCRSHLQVLIVTKESKISAKLAGDSELQHYREGTKLCRKTENRVPYLKIENLASKLEKNADSVKNVHNQGTCDKLLLYSSCSVSTKSCFSMTSVDNYRLSQTNKHNEKH